VRRGIGRSGRRAGAGRPGRRRRRWRCRPSQEHRSDAGEKHHDHEHQWPSLVVRCGFAIECLADRCVVHLCLTADRFRRAPWIRPAQRTGICCASLPAADARRHSSFGGSAARSGVIESGQSVPALRLLFLASLQVEQQIQQFEVDQIGHGPHPHHHETDAVQEILSKPAQFGAVEVRDHAVVPHPYADA